ncbi:MAG: RseA family anti-sigma factor [Gammaproteobacteria bacterium]
MTTTKAERLSALVDDEIGTFERHRLLDELARNPEDRSRWGRYHLISAVLHQEMPSHLDMQFADRLRQRLDAEDAPHGQWVRKWSRLGRPAAGFALAASVAWMAVIGFQNLVGEPEGTALETASRIPAELQQVAEQEFAASPDPAVERRFSTYIVNHSEHAAQQGVIPYVRLVDYGTMQQP